MGSGRFPQAGIPPRAITPEVPRNHAKHSFERGAMASPPSNTYGKEVVV